MLYAYFEYTGSDFAADMAKMAADPKTQEWWAIMEPMQDPCIRPGKRASGGQIWKRFFISIDLIILSVIDYYLQKKIPNRI